MTPLILLVDDDRSTRRIIMGGLKQNLDINFMQAEHGADALRILSGDNGGAVKLVILDINMPVMDGIDTLRHIGKNYPHLPVIIITDPDETEKIDEAMVLGAFDFISKPIQNARLEVSVKNALKFSSIQNEIFNLQSNNQKQSAFRSLIGWDQGLKPCIAMAEKAAACNLPVLIMGETGTGKEMFARAIHEESKRNNDKFVAVNCGAIPENLVESTLFGHEKGAFTGATDKVIGKFREADGGTIFLDEIGELPHEAQVKLLRVLQQKEVEPVGAASPVKVDVRIISATNRTLQDQVQKGAFREDLYFRLNVLEMNIIPLRERPEDIPLLINYFINKFCVEHNMPIKRMNAHTLSIFIEKQWQGNVRELENLVYRLIAMSEGEELVWNEANENVESSKPSVPQIPSKKPSNNLINPVHENGAFKSFKEIEEEIITAALAHNKHNVTATAKTLGIAKSTLYLKMSAMADK